MSTPQWNPSSQPTPGSQAPQGASPYGQGQPGGWNDEPAGWNEGSQWAHDPYRAAGQYPGGPQQAEHPDGVLVFVLGLVSLLIFQPLGFVPWYLGNKAQRDVDSRPGFYRNEGLITAGRIMGIIAAVITILGVLFLGAMLLFGLGLPLLIGIGAS